MLSLLTRPRWTPPSVQVNAAHPLARGLMIAVPGWVCNGQRELLSGRTGTPTTLDVPGVGAYGRAVKLEGATAGSGVEWTFASGDPWAISPPLTVAAVVHKVTDNGSNNATLFGAVGGGIGGECWKVGYVGAAQWKFAYNDNASLFELGTTSAVTHRGIMVIVATLASGGATLFLNGVQNATGTGASAVSYTAPVKVAVGRTQGPIADIVYLGAAWKRALTAVEVAAFTADPFAMFHQSVPGLAAAVATTVHRRPIFRRF